MKQRIRQWGTVAAVFVVLLGASVFLLKEDVWTFFTWWLLAFLMGMLAMPVTGRLFAHFEDKGWIFSKVLAISVSGFAVWFLVSIKVMPFTRLCCTLVCLILAVLCVLLFRSEEKREVDCFPWRHIQLICWEELLFLAIFLVWTYLAGFHPQAYGTEKFMDYGFMEAMMRSEVLPAKDMWYSEGHMNYYYGGQYFAVFLTKISGTMVEQTYNLMRTFVAALAFAMPFSLVYQLMRDRLAGKDRYRWAPAVSGLIGGTAVSIAGNMHYVIYGQIIPLYQKLIGAESIDSYWFPDATRYIGYNPDVPDKTIHEFPCYSFVLGDLHAHVVNIMFVLLMLGILYAWMYRMRKEMPLEPGIQFWKKEIFSPYVFCVGFLLGMYQWTNYWDFVIYFVVAGAVVLFANIIRFEGKIKQVLALTAVQAAEFLVISALVIIPFTIQFETMAQGVGIARNHSRFYQLLVLWGLPSVLVLLFLISLSVQKLKRKENRNLYKLMRAVSIPDLFVVITGLCAMGLVLIPELVYVKDIYGEGYSRANTMFKLTYQAYIMFGISMGYIIFRLLLVSRQKILKLSAGIGLFFLIWTVGYFGNSVQSWFGKVWNPSQYKGLDATEFLETDFAEDAAGIRWLKENIEGVPVVLEANGDSYTRYERVSAATGLPTVLGWYVHEWLWRNDVGDLNRKSADIEAIYTSQDAREVRRLLEQYQISYVFVGSTERDKYGENLNNEMLKSMGETVFSDAAYGTYIVRVD